VKLVSWILASAVLAQADLVATGDKNGLLQSRQVERVAIVNARQALDRLAGV
jgi:predicted nucleic acid-binding protein